MPVGWLAMLAQLGWAPAITCTGLMVLLFPDGKLPSPRWRWALGPYLVLAALWIIGALAFTVAAIVAHHVHVDAGGNLLALQYPSGSAAWWGTAQGAFFIMLAISWLASLPGRC